MHVNSVKGLRKARVRIGNFFREEQTVTRNCALWIRVRVGELSRSSDAWVNGESQRQLVPLQMRLCEGTPWVAS